MPPQQSKAPDFIPADPDFIPATEVSGAAERTPSMAHEPGFFESIRNSLGINSANPPKFSWADALGGPALAAAKGIGSEFMRSTGELGKAVDEMRSNPAQAGLHAISAVPVIGPGLVTAGQQAPASRPGESYMSRVKSAATDPGTMGTTLGTAIQAAPMVLGAFDTAFPGRSLMGRIPTRAHAGEVLENVRKEVNRPRMSEAIRPRGYLMPPVEEVPLHRQPFTAGESSRPIVLNQADKPSRLLLNAPSQQLPLSEKVDIFPNQLSHADTNIREEFGGPTQGLGHSEYVGEIPGTYGGREPLQGTMLRRPAMSPSEPPAAAPYYVNQVNLKHSLPALEEAQRLSEEGHGTITPLDSFYRRVNTINPLDYDEAFSRRSALGSLTGEDKMRATPSLQAAAKKFHRALGEDIGETAERAGVGDQYRQGMREYRNAMMVRKGLIHAGKMAIPTAAGYGAYHFLKPWIPGR